ncbi:hypothetical protein RirG_011230 [Rhizophagus irregularis DAOM 197198w]|uniref:Uncharacterized protein n=1 Tax=Rhizophagus irregularis (strain DAOM 197198w) TaxID=1432141 RepID=A0A015KGS3_RHIIW|nr:hypothetical protein RirG_011230 [Rhizophagus irregularis DAOM 197198w]
MDGWCMMGCGWLMEAPRTPRWWWPGFVDDGWWMMDGGWWWFGWMEQGRDGTIDKPPLALTTLAASLSLGLLAAGSCRGR